jgi:hypothetical protein
VLVAIGDSSWPSPTGAPARRPVPNRRVPAHP